MRDIIILGAFDESVSKVCVVCKHQIWWDRPEDGEGIMDKDYHLHTLHPRTEGREIFYFEALFPVCFHVQPNRADTIEVYLKGLKVKRSGNMLVWNSQGDPDATTEHVLTAMLA